MSNKTERIALSPEVKTIAAQLFSDLTNGPMRNRDQKLAAREAVRRALALEAIFSAIESGQPLEEELSEEEKARAALDDAYAPNLDPKHPINMRSKRFGTPETLARFAAMTPQERQAAHVACSTVARN